MERARQFLSFQALGYVALGLIGAATVATGLTLWALRGDAIKAAQQDTSHVAVILANQINRSVREIDVVLEEFSRLASSAGLVTRDQVHRKLTAPALFTVMVQHLEKIPQADVITVLDSHGRALNSTMPQVASMDFSDRDYFVYHRENVGPRLYVSVPVAGKVSGVQKIFFSRRINGASGDFVGLVLVGIPVAYFQRSYDAIGAVAGQSLLLLRQNGTILVRYPDANPFSGRVIPGGSPWYDLAHGDGGHYRSPGYFDDHGARLVAVRPLRDYPLVVNVSIMESAALEVWKERAALIGLGIALTALCSLVLLRALDRQFRRLSESEASLSESNLRLDVALNNMSHGLAMFDKDARLMVCNARFGEMHRLPAEVTKPGRTLLDVLEARKAGNTFFGDPVRFAAELRARIAEGRPDQYKLETPDGRAIAVSNYPIPNGGWVTTHEDVTERHRNEARIAHMARYDALTDLPNRILVRERMDGALADLRATSKGFAVFIFDLDLFKAVNDSLGHPTGDALLKAIAARLKSCAHERCVIGRIGGDEFAVIQISDGDQKQGATRLAETLLRTISAPYLVDGHPIVIGISIGIALAPQDGVDASDLLKNADLALYRAKSEGRKGYRFFSPEMDEDARVRLELEIELRNALAGDEFEIHYQPILNVQSHRPCGAEALVRWRHPTRGLIGPDRFIPLAEDSGFIIPLGEWILREACREAAGWPSSIRLAVNLSPVQFRSAELVETVKAALQVSGLAPERLELEITESVLLHKDPNNIEMLARLGKLGVGIVLDDFGTGYSSLSYLRLHKFSKVKIDKSFVAELPQQSDCAAIICAITGLARSLGIDTTAEGVETAEQFALLRAAGCDQAQGFLFSRPQPAGNLTFDIVFAVDDHKAA